eukprot:TRINITY_DN2798_c0_g2_i1.p2 TRINITY_DN2798_c0_g2~~TRINITY_DN2798_c0_g2_i1.p2  ORF type:complete len:140 (+),score=33.53 TRINITY_DN2798_c0_g2_i1:19-438(+)
MKATTIAIVAALLVACAISGAAAISACDTARYLRNAGVPEANIGPLVCTAKYESSFNCGATHRNNDGPTDYGPLQVNSYWWCSGDAKSKHNGCNTSCQNLLNCQANANCARIVLRQQGMEAWYAYRSHRAECSAARPPC